MFSHSKGHSGPWLPQFYWTDSEIRVHALYCQSAVLLLAGLQIQLRRTGIPLNPPRAIEQISGIQNTLVINANGAGERVLSIVDEDQRQLAEGLGLTQLARRMGAGILDHQ